MQQPSSGSDEVRLQQQLAQPASSASWEYTNATIVISLAMTFFLATKTSMLTQPRASFTYLTKILFLISLLPTHRSSPTDYGTQRSRFIPQ